MATRIDISGIPEILRLLGSAPETPPQAARRREIFGDEEVMRGEMPLSPGSLLGVARRVPDVIKKLKALFTPTSGASTGRRGRALQQVILQDEPAQLTRRELFVSPIEAIADLERGLGHVGDWHEEATTSWQVPDYWDVDEGMPAWDDDHRLATDEEVDRARAMIDKMRGIRSDRPGLLGDIESLGRIMADQEQKEIMKSTGEGVEEGYARRRAADRAPGPVAKTAEGVRRRFGRRKRP